jgi:hypothetical protein
MSVYRRILRSADSTHPYWVALQEEKCVGARYERLRAFCAERGLSLSRHGHSVAREHGWYQVFMFADVGHAEIFRAEFCGERMHPSEKGRGARWTQWKKKAGRR